jgi:hypothetical protein
MECLTSYWCIYHSNCPTFRAGQYLHYSGKFPSSHLPSTIHFLNVTTFQVHKFRDKLPASLLRILVSPQVFKIGSAVKGDLTRLKHQFSQLKHQTSFNFIDLKEYCTQRRIVPRKAHASLDILLEKTCGKYLSKDESLRKCEEWETRELRPDLLQYAALDVFASRIIFEKAAELAAPEKVNESTPPGTRVVLLVQEGGIPAAYGKVSDIQPDSWGGIRVKVANRNRVLIEVDSLVVPSAAAILHRLSGRHPGKTKTGSLTLQQLQDASNSTTFRVVAPFSHLQLDVQDTVSGLHFATPKKKIIKSPITRTLI